MRHWSMPKLSLVVLGMMGLTLVFQNCSQVGFREELASTQSVPIEEPPVCLFDGNEYQEGERVALYEAPSVLAPNQCVVEERECRNGVMTGSFTFPSCSVTPQAKASCQWQGQVVPDGQSVKAYAVQVTGDKIKGHGYIWAPIAERRTCKNGILSGSFRCQSWAEIYGWADCIIYYWSDEIPKDAVLVPVSE